MNKEELIVRSFTRKPVWVCAACGKWGPTRRSVGDESCYLHAVQCWPSSLVFEGWQVRRGVVASEEWVEPALLRPQKSSRRPDAPARIRRLERRAARRATQHKSEGNHG